LYDEVNDLVKGKSDDLGIKFIFFLGGKEFELRVLCRQSRSSTVSHTSSPGVKFLNSQEEMGPRAKKDIQLSLGI
jgi:hypothetical protein